MHARGAVAGTLRIHAVVILAASAGFLTATVAPEREPIAAVAFIAERPVAAFADIDL